MNIDLTTIITTAVLAGTSSTGLMYLLLKSYLTEKGKNLATREDVAAITKEVETVKEVFTSKTEQLKTDLQYFNQVRFSIKTEERNAIVNCYESYEVWVNRLIDFAFLYHTDQSLEDLQKNIDAVHATYSQMMISEAKMKLYIGACDYTNQFHDLKILTIGLHSYTLRGAQEYYDFIKKNAIKEPVMSEPDSSDEIIAINNNDTARMRLIISHNEGVMKHYEVISKQERLWRAESLKKLTTLASQVSQH